MTSPLGFKARVRSPIHTWQRHIYMWCTFHEIHLWCYTRWPLDGQHGSWVILFHVPVSNHWWGSKLRPIMPPLTVWDQADFVSEENSLHCAITSFCWHFTYMETLWKVVKWSIKWQWDPIEMFGSRHTFFLWPYGPMWSSSVKLLTWDDAGQFESPHLPRPLLYPVMN